MNGTIWVESEKGEGSSFIFTVKLAPVNASEIEKTEHVSLKNDKKAAGSIQSWQKKRR
ncbi:MAG: hypothetical protein R3C26_21320 [Calditrichia bacterium]